MNVYVMCVPALITSLQAYSCQYLGGQSAGSIKPISLIKLYNFIGYLLLMLTLLVVSHKVLFLQLPVRDKSVLAFQEILYILLLHKHS